MYAYPSGAVYEGEWRNNVKEGRGVYLYGSGESCSTFRWNGFEMVVRKRAVLIACATAPLCPAVLVCCVT